MSVKIPSKYLRSLHVPNDIQVIHIEVNLKQRIQTFRSEFKIFLSSITDLLDHNLKTYDDFIVITDLFLDDKSVKTSKIKLVLNQWKDHVLT